MPMKPMPTMPTFNIVNSLLDRFFYMSLVIMGPSPLP